MIYLASPYSHIKPSVVETRFETVCRAAGRLMMDGHIIFSPIAHTHPIAKLGKLPSHWEFWRMYDEVMLDACDELWVLKMPGWDESRGVAGEIAYIKQSTEKPIKYIDPEPSDYGV